MKKREKEKTKKSPEVSRYKGFCPIRSAYTSSPVVKRSSPDN